MSQSLIASTTIMKREQSLLFLNAGPVGEPAEKAESRSWRADHLLPAPVLAVYIAEAQSLARVAGPF